MLPSSLTPQSGGFAEAAILAWIWTMPLLAFFVRRPLFGLSGRTSLPGLPVFDTFMLRVMAS